MERRDRSPNPAELLDQHRRLTSRLARRYGRFEAEDLASEALARSLRRPAPEGARQPWLERIVRNLVVDRARRSSRAAAHAAALACVADRGAAATPEEDLLRAERRRALQQALPTIPSGLRDAVVGRFYEGHDYDAVAATRGISPATARTRVHRALATLRLSLGRLRAALPWPQIAGPHAFSTTAALVPAALSAALVLPSLATAWSPRPAVDVAAVLVAEASRSARTRPPSIQPLANEPLANEPLARSEAAVAAPVAPAAKVTRTAPAARAQPSGDGEPAAASSQGDRPAAVTKYDFENDEVEGTLARPDGIQVQGDAVVKHASLIEIRREFVGEIAKMLEDF